MNFHGVPVAGKCIAAGGVAFLENLQVQVGEHALELLAVMTAAALFVDEELKVLVAVALPGLVDQLGSEVEKHGGFVVHFFNELVEFASGQQARFQAQHPDFIVGEVSGQGGGGDGDIVAVILERPVGGGKAVPGVLGQFVEALALEVIEKIAEGSRWVNLPIGLQECQHSALEASVIPAALMQLFTVVNEYAAGASLLFLAQASAEQGPKRRRQMLIGQFEGHR